MNAAATLPTTIDVAIIGSGFSGLATAQRLLEHGHRDLVILERAQDVGGTWRDNSYPGCACDVPSHLYSLSFAPNAEWTSTFSPQPEILEYLRTVAREHGLLEHVRFGVDVQGATWDAAARRWNITTSRGDLVARVLVSAAGPLAEPKLPDVAGIADFEGTVFHSARWDHDHDLAGKRVAVVGTGASAIQFVPRIAGEVGQLHVFQRTAPWIMPRNARGLTAPERRVYRRFPAAQRLMREGIFWAREGLALPLKHNGWGKAMKVVAAKHLQRAVKDPALRAKLTPDYEPGCKRILISNDYLPALVRDNVEVLTTGVVKITKDGVVGADGTERAVDTIIFGTGFEVTEVPIAQHIRDGAGRTLAEHWDGSMQAHRGTTVAGFPNLYLVLGPNCGTGHTSVVLMAEAQADYIAQALDHQRTHGIEASAPTAAAQEAWNVTVQDRMQGTVWTDGGCASWYLDRNGKNTTLWPDFAFRFRRSVKRYDAEAYATT